MAYTGTIVLKFECPAASATPRKSSFPSRVLRCQSSATATANAGRLFLRGSSWTRNLVSSNDRAWRNSMRYRVSDSHTVRCGTIADFDSMAAGKERKYFLIGGKGGVGKTSLAASLAVKFANNGHPTLIVSTDPAHSLSDSLAVDVTGGKPVLVEGTDLPLAAIELDPEEAREEFRSFAEANDTAQGVQDFLGSVGLAGIYDSLVDLKLGELLDTPPPGLDEAVAISKVVQFTKEEKYKKYTRIVFDTAPTGHTLRLLALPDFLDKSIGKVVKLRQKILGATSAIKGLFGAQEADQDQAVQKLEELKERVIQVRDLFRDSSQTEFIIATIPTVMAANESKRLLEELRLEGVPCRRIVINQLLPPVDEENSVIPKEAMQQLSNMDAEYGTHLQAYARFCDSKRKDQLRALHLMKEDAQGLQTLKQVEAPLFDLEIRGVPALRFFGDQVWK
mmetsp:Transcript_34179/g.65299  ORF Transcript_34179/g.65299 Transcript_34179/m.65299 type:complete len:449 (+) Transcript_34179:123-1469(+)